MPEANVDIVILDSDVQSRSLQCAALSRAGWDSVLATHDPREALLCMGAGGVRLLICDQTFESGVEPGLLKLLRASDRTRKIAIIVTGPPGAQREARARSLGADVYLPKPIPPELLRTTIRVLVGLG